MTHKARLKFTIFLVILAVMMPLLAGLFLLLNQFIAYFQQGANPASIFHGHVLMIPDEEIARWLPIGSDFAGLPPKISEQEEMIAAYRDAWDALGRAHLTGDTTDLATTWAGAAYHQALASVDPKRPITQTHTGHALLLTFFSEDGSVVAFKDQHFILEQQTKTTTLTLEVSADVVMTIDQGFWRIRQLTLYYR